MEKIEEDINPIVMDYTDELETPSSLPLKIPRQLTKDQPPTPSTPTTPTTPTTPSKPATKPKPKQMKADAIVSREYEDQDTDCLSSYFKSCLSFKGCLCYSLTVFCGCCGCGPSVVVPEGHRGAVLVYGKLDRIVQPGTYTYNAGTEDYKICPVSVITLEMPNQKLITKDNVSIELDAVCFYQITNVQCALFNVRNYEKATRCLAQTTIEKIIAEHTLDELITTRTEITQRTTQAMDKHTKNWGIHVSGLQIRDIKLPTSMQRVMAVSAEAQRGGEANNIMAQAEQKASENYVKAASVLEGNPLALQLRYLHTLKELAGAKNRTILISSDLTDMFKEPPRWDTPYSYPDPFY